MSQPPDLSAADFDFHLPPNRIAQTPASPRDAARLLVVDDPLQDRTIRDLPTLLRPGDLIVANDTRVIPAQLQARRGAAQIGLTLDRPLADGTWHALARNARRLRPGDQLDIEGAEDFTATLQSRDPDGGVILKFTHPNRLAADLNQAGALALPPYIDRPTGPTPADTQDYQTIFADTEGAVAAPTAGLHFTDTLLADLKAAGIHQTTLTLHVGAGTFLPMRAENIAHHHIHAERGHLSQNTADTINATKQRGGRIVAIGTTTLRLLEAAADQHGTLHPYTGETSIFITPNTPIKTADLLLTNFHLPRSTLFLLVCAFAGTTRMHAAYTHAITHAYRFYSYGDACLLRRT